MVSLGLSLGLAEIVLRAADIDRAAKPFAEGRIRRNTGDADRPYVYIPGSTRTHTYPRSGGDPDVTTTHINALGLRGADQVREKPPGVLRIACVGDSVTFGFGVDDHATWPAVLTTCLEQLVGAGRVQTLNFGMEATDTPQQATLLERSVLGYEPDVVLLGFYLNDVGQADDAADGTGHFGRGVRDLLRPDREGFVGWLRKHSRLVDVLGEQVHLSLSRRKYAEVYTAEYRSNGAGWRRARQALRRVHELVEQQGSEFLVITYPMLVRRGADFASRDAYEVVHAFCADEDIPSLDVSPALQDQSVHSLRNHHWEGHPNALANRLVARVIARRLVETVPLLASWAAERDASPR